MLYSIFGCGKTVIYKRKEIYDRKHCLYEEFKFYFFVFSGKIVKYQQKMRGMRV